MPDPADPQSLNRYTYALNNAIKYTDPSGHAYDAGLNEGGQSCNYDATSCNIINLLEEGQRHFFSEEYGYFDVAHIMADIGRTRDVISQMGINRIGFLCAQ